MINTLEGKVTIKEESFLVLNVNNIGYKIFVGTDLQNVSVGTDLFVYTYLSVKETSLELYGFATHDYLKIFELLLTISGIGPKAALGILSVSTPASLKKAVLTENTDELTKVSGIGKKNAQKIIIELKNKIEKIKLDQTVSESFDLEVYETLESLGFERTKVREVLTELDESLNTEQKIKMALKILGRK
ncbi:Holliday junction branch migration protein RuvA [Candidatus Campbellbacteria bacterium]|nr:MAG: Holliday junction branch migration protein RuvA [Candidatus Campbellbacteria bacterium]